MYAEEVKNIDGDELNVSKRLQFSFVGGRTAWRRCQQRAKGGHTTKETSKNRRTTRRATPTQDGFG
jgi:hypothetical protein